MFLDVNSALTNKLCSLQDFLHVYAEFGLLLIFMKVVQYLLSNFDSQLKSVSLFIIVACI